MTTVHVVREEELGKKSKAQIFKQITTEVLHFLPVAVLNHAQEEAQWVSLRLVVSPERRLKWVFDFIRCNEVSSITQTEYCGDNDPYTSVKVSTYGSYVPLGTLFPKNVRQGGDLEAVAQFLNGFHDFPRKRIVYEGLPKYSVPESSSTPSRKRRRTSETSEVEETQDSSEPLDSSGSDSYLESDEDPDDMESESESDDPGESDVDPLPDVSSLHQEQENRIAQDMKEYYGQDMTLFRRRRKKKRVVMKDACTQYEWIPTPVFVCEYCGCRTAGFSLYKGIYVCTDPWKVCTRCVRDFQSTMTPEQKAADGCLESKILNKTCGMVDIRRRGLKLGVVDTVSKVTYTYESQDDRVKRVEEEAVAKEVARKKAEQERREREEERVASALVQNTPQHTVFIK
jgi:hypothetical protein